jgi:hypothetical protein
MILPGYCDAAMLAAWDFEMAGSADIANGVEPSNTLIKPNMSSRRFITGFRTRPRGISIQRAAWKVNQTGRNAARLYYPLWTITLSV